MTGIQVDTSPCCSHLGAECVRFEGGAHRTVIDPVGNGQWRSACDTCGTVLSASHPNRSAAYCRAMNHAHLSPEVRT